MIALAFALYLLAFYILPYRHGAVYQWAWVHARERYPSLFWQVHHHVLWNGAFYVEMLLWWALFLAVAALLEWALRKDDAAWGGLFDGFGRQAGLGVVNAALLLAYGFLVGYCALNGLPLHGPLSAGLTIGMTLIALPLLRGLNLRRLKPKISTGSLPADNTAPTSPEESRALAPDTPSPAMSLTVEPPPIDMERLKRIVEEGAFASRP